MIPRAFHRDIVGAGLDRIARDCFDPPLRIAERVVVLKTMPLGNVTGITKEERELLGRWIQTGARLR